MKTQLGMLRDIPLKKSCVFGKSPPGFTRVTILEGVCLGATAAWCMREDND